MREERIAAIRAMIDALNADHDENEQFVRGLLARPPDEWDAWRQHRDDRARDVHGDEHEIRICDASRVRHAESRR